MTHGKASSSLTERPGSYTSNAQRSRLGPDACTTGEHDSAPIACNPMAMVKYSLTLERRRRFAAWFAEVEVLNHVEAKQTGQ